MKNGPIFLKPTNRYLLIVPHYEKSSNDSTVLLPDDFELEINRHIVATVVDVAADCSKQFDSLRKTSFTEKENRQIIIDASMIEVVDILDKKFNLILENFVLGILKQPEAC